MNQPNIDYLLSANHFTLSYAQVTCYELIQRVEYNKNSIKGAYFVLDDNGKLLNIITDGDIRRGLSSGLNLNTTITEFYRTKPFISIEKSDNLLSPAELLSKIKKLSFELGLKTFPRYVPIIHNSLLHSVVDTTRLLVTTHLQPSDSSLISIIGLGYVGLTLCASLSSKGYKVVGYDINSNLVDDLSNNIIHIEEPGLEEIVSSSQSSDLLTFAHINNIAPSSVYIVCVGTSIRDGQLDETAIQSALDSITSVIQNDTHIYLRSTLPIGYCRKILKKLQSRLDSNQSGFQITISFAPERTIEGNALQELDEIPQIVSSSTKEGLKEAVDFWSKVAISVIECRSLEEAELIKLISNTYRDTSFAFSNYVALLCSQFSINAHRLIQRANEGYPRNNIPLPSPGVGGYCLTKDPFLLESSSTLNLPKFPTMARRINELAQNYPVDILESWVSKHNLSPSNLNVLVIGLAFKGNPPTSDIRSSPSLHLIQYLKSKNIKFTIYDSVISHLDALDNFPQDICENLYASSNSIDIVDFNCIFCLNNHQANKSISFKSFATDTSGQYRLFFDGWFQFPYLESLSSEFFEYITMGLSSQWVKYFGTYVVMEEGICTDLGIFLKTLNLKVALYLLISS